MVCLKQLSFEIQAGFDQYASKHWASHASHSQEDTLAVLVRYLRKHQDRVICATKGNLDLEYRRSPSLLHVLAVLGLANCIMVDSIPDLEARDSGGLTPLFYAVWCERLECLKALLRRGADPNAKNNLGQTPLSYAGERSLREVVDILIVAGADVNLPDQHGRTPFFWAAREDLSYRWTTPRNLIYPPIAMTLIEAGANKDLADQTGTTPLMDAIRRRDVYSAIFLINQGADLEVVDNEGQTALIHAAKRGNKRILQKLVDKGANVDHADNYSRTGLIYAVEHGWAAAVNILVKARTNA
jgi:ankyrin repeat protein